MLGSAVALLATGQATAATPPTGGAKAGPTPKLRTLTCRTACAGVSVARAGSRVRAGGRSLAGVDSVVFQGLPGGADDVSVAPLRARKKYVDARVPRTAVSGPVVLVSVDGAESPPSVPLTIDTTAPAPASTGGSGAGLGIDVEVQGNRVFYGAERMAQVSYLVRGSQPADVAIELVRLSDGLAITRWEPGEVAPETPQTVVWDGTAGGKVQRDGRYAFRVVAQSATGATASSSQVPAPTTKPAPGSFLFQRHIFPIRGRHTMGTGAAAFGGGRGHQGQDTFAKCGTPLVAARAGVVKFKQYHSRAGHYIVIDGDNEGYDYAYMHMRDASLVDEGDHVYTGQPIGFVGDTGHAQGCHLHFEVWKAPGWYSGGSPINPLPLLQGWDRTS